MFEPFRAIDPYVAKLLINSYQKNRLAHAYLFEGEPGTPKRELALAFAKLLYCEGEEKPCGQCMNCIRIDNRNHPNVLFIEPEGQTLKKEQILYLQREYVKTALEPGPKVYIIDQIDRMSTSAANSILKFIEEPEPDVYTILITDHLHQILPTIISRSQVINFRPVDPEALQKRLVAEGCKPLYAGVIAHLTNDFAEAKRLATDESFRELVDFAAMLGEALILGQPDPITLCETKRADLYTDRESLDYCLRILVLYMQDLYKGKLGKGPLIFRDAWDRLKGLMERMPMEWLNQALKLLLTAQMDLRENGNPLLVLDGLLIKLIKVV